MPPRFPVSGSSSAHSLTWSASAIYLLYPLFGTRNPDSYCAIRLAAPSVTPCLCHLCPRLSRRGQTAAGPVWYQPHLLCPVIHRFFKGSFEFVQIPFKLCTQVPVIISIVIKKQTRINIPKLFHCALDHARAVARSRADNKQGYNAITYKNNAVSSGFGGCSISFYRKLSYNKAKLLQACMRNYISVVWHCRPSSIHDGGQRISSLAMSLIWTENCLVGLCWRTIFL